MDRYCTICGEVILEENISGAIAWELWEEFGAVECHESGSSIPPEYLVPPESANWKHLHMTDQGDWVHLECYLAFGSGQTPEEMNRHFYKGLQDFLSGEE